MVKKKSKNKKKCKPSLTDQARIFLEKGDVHQAEVVCTKAVKQGNTDPEMLLYMGNVHYFRQRYGDAINCCQQLLQLQPKNSNARILLWAVYRDSGNFDSMLDFTKQLQKQPLNADENLLVYRGFMAACDWHNAEKMQGRILEMAEQGEISHKFIPALLFELCEMTGLSSELIFNIHQQWGNREIKGKLPFYTADSSPAPVKERLKIAYISADLYQHPVGIYMHQIIQEHDHQHFEVYCYAYLVQNDHLTQQIRESTDHFVDITKLSHADTAARIHADGIHILIDLGGHSGNTQLPVLAYRPAPVQMTYLGYPNTTGLPTVDYRITDHFAECEEGTRYVEKLLYMPQSFLCYGVNASTLEENKRLPAGEKAHIIFASFNNIRKITPQTIQAWADILKRVPASRLALKSKGLSNIIVRDNILREFASHGVQAERIEIRPCTATYAEHMVQYSSIDIALDTFPYNGTTTTCDALAMGVPVITLTGKLHAQRVSYSILKNIGFEDTITSSIDEYVNKAVAMATNPQGLTMLHQILPIMFRHSILCQPEKFTKQLEGLYLQAWHEKNMPGNKESRSIIFIDQLTPDVWKSLNAFYTSTDGDSPSFIVAALFSSENQEKISGYVHEMSLLDATPSRQLHIIRQPDHIDIENFIRSLVQQCDHVHLLQNITQNQLVVKNITMETQAKIIAHNEMPKYIPTPLPPLQNMKVTVCMATYNRCELLKRAIHSVLAQTYDNFELIISDNASTDGTEEYCRSMVESDSRIRYIRNAENIGYLDNFFQLYNMIETDMYILVNDDDFIYPEHLTRTMGMMQLHPELGLVFGQSHIGNVSGKNVDSIIPSNYTEDCIVEPRQMLLDSIFGNQICWVSVLFRKSAVEYAMDCAGDLFDMDRKETHFGRGDYFFDLLMVSCVPVGYVNIPAGFYSIHDEAFSSNQFGGGWSLEIRVRTLSYLVKMYKAHYGVDALLQRRLIPMLNGFEQSVQSIEAPLLEKNACDEDMEKMNELKALLNHINKVAELHEE